MVSLGLQRPFSIGPRPLPGERASIAVVRERHVIFRFAAYEVDLMRQELRHGGAVVPTEPQVFDVLSYLLQNRERIVSKDELLGAVWEGRIVSDAALNSRISAARRAIGDDGTAQALIRTAHRRGFRFVGEVHVDDVTLSADGELKEHRRSKSSSRAPPHSLPPKRFHCPASRRSPFCRSRT